MNIHKLTIDMLCREGLRMLHVKNGKNSKIKFTTEQNSKSIAYSFILPEEYLEWSLDDISDLFLEPAIKFLNFMVDKYLENHKHVAYHLTELNSIEWSNQSFDGMSIRLSRESKDEYIFVLNFELIEQC